MLKNSIVVVKGLVVVSVTRRSNVDIAKSGAENVIIMELGAPL